MEKGRLHRRSCSRGEQALTSPRMGTRRLCSWLLFLVISLCPSCHASPLVGAGKWVNDAIQLGMEMNAAAYIFTQSKASDQLAIDYLQEEGKKNQTLADVWRSAVEKRSNDARLSKLPVPEGLREEHVVAVIAYTLAAPGRFYSMFNAAMRMYGTNDSVYAEKFPFKSFHYLLSVFLDRLRDISGREHGTMYRGMAKLALGQVGRRMKFGYFASSSTDKRAARQFSAKTMFTIHSEYGVKIQKYSSFPNEEEVLIPPSELFSITEYIYRPGGVAISLQSVGMDGIRVKVERGSKGEMRVVRSEGVANSALAGLCMLMLLGPIAL